jgi:peptide/nickel transport system permease protein
MGLDQPMWKQFINYIAGMFQGDLGISYKYSLPVTGMIKEAFPHTVKLTLLAIIFAWVIGLVSGIVAAIRQNKLLDRLFMGFALMGVSMPVFMTALFLQYLLAFKLHWFSLTSDGTIISMILPAIALGWNSAGSIARITRSSLLEVMQADYIDTARAKGLAKGAVILGHALKNSMLPVITMMALQLSSMLSGAVITESIFGIPGIGRLATTAITNRDMPVLQGTVIVTTIIVIAGNLLADLLYSVLDPRIRKGN